MAAAASRLLTAGESIPVCRLQLGTDQLNVPAGHELAAGSRKAGLLNKFRADGRLAFRVATLIDLGRPAKQALECCSSSSLNLAISNLNRQVKGGYRPTECRS